MYAPYKDRIIAFVESHPGCCKMDVAKYCTYNRLRDPSKQYYLVNTAIKYGWIRAEFKRGRYYLYPAE